MESTCWASAKASICLKYSQQYDSLPLSTLWRMPKDNQDQIKLGECQISMKLGQIHLHKLLKNHFILIVMLNPMPSLLWWQTSGFFWKLLTTPCSRYSNLHGSRLSYRLLPKVDMTINYPMNCIELTTLSSSRVPLINYNPTFHYL